MLLSKFCLRGSLYFYGANGVGCQSIVGIFAQGGVVEQPEVLVYLSIQVIVSGLRIQQLRHPHHAQHTLNRGRKAHPVVGTDGHFVVGAVLDGVNALPGGILTNGSVYAAGGKQNHIRIPLQDLLNINLVAGALGGGGLYNCQVVGKQVNDLSMVAALGDDIFALITQAVQQVYLLYARGDLIGAVINLVAVLTQGVALGLLASRVPRLR